MTLTGEIMFQSLLLSGKDGNQLVVVVMAMEVVVVVVVVVVVAMEVVSSSIVGKPSGMDFCGFSPFMVSKRSPPYYSPTAMQMPC